MTHPNRLLHRKDVEAGVIDKNPYPQDLKPQEAELDTAIDLTTKRVQNEEASGQAVLGEEREALFPTFSMHGKSGNMHIDRDGTYRLVNCKVEQLSFETAATVILINTSVNEITGEVADTGPSGTTHIRFIFIDSKLGKVTGAHYFFLSLHGNTNWDGGLDGCRHGSVRLLQSRNWTAADNFVSCEDIVVSVSMTNGANVTPVGGTFASNCKRLRFQWHGTDLSMGSGTLFASCSDILSHHHGCDVKAGTNLAKGSTNIGVVLHASQLFTIEWVFLETQRPTISAISTTINTGDPANSGLFKSCGRASCYLGNNTQCNTGGILSGENGALTLAKATVSAGSALIDATNSTVAMRDAEVETSGGPAAVKLENSRIELNNMQVKSATLAFDFTGTTAEIKGGKAEGASGGFKMANSNVTLKHIEIESGGDDMSAEGGVLKVEGSKGVKSLKADGCDRVVLSGAEIGTDAEFKNVGSVEIQSGKAGGDVTFTGVSSLQMRAVEISGNVTMTGIDTALIQANQVGGSLSFAGNRFDSGGNSFGGGGSVNAGFGALGGDSFGGALTLTGVFLVGGVNAADVTNKGFMLLEGGSGSSKLPLAKRGWNISGTMEQNIETDLLMNIGAEVRQVAGTSITIKAPKIDHN